MTRNLRSGDLWLAAGIVFLVAGVGTAIKLIGHSSSESLPNSREVSSPSPLALMPLPTPRPTSTAMPTPISLSVRVVGQDVKYDHDLPLWADAYKVILPRGEWYDTGIPVIANYNIYIKDSDFNNNKRWEYRLDNRIYYPSHEGNEAYYCDDTFQERNGIRAGFIDTIKLRYPDGGSLYLTLYVYVRSRDGENCQDDIDCKHHAAIHRSMEQKLVALRNKIPGSELWR
jgi:hypothetical protein